VIYITSAAFVSDGRFSIPILHLSRKSFSMSALACQQELDEMCKKWQKRSRRGILECSRDAEWKSWFNANVKMEEPNCQPRKCSKCSEMSYQYVCPVCASTGFDGLLDALISLKQTPPSSLPSAIKLGYSSEFLYFTRSAKAVVDSLKGVGAAGYEVYPLSELQGKGIEVSNLRRTLKKHQQDWDQFTIYKLAEDQFWVLSSSMRTYGNDWDSWHTELKPSQTALEIAS
jgi:hypothetical protein